MKADATTTVIDAGARYGMHPTWRSFGGALRYFAFEPDPHEAERLRRRGDGDGVEVVELGLGREEGERELRLTKHRGCSSFLEVDLNSEWFARYRVGEGDVESVIRVKTCAIDDFARARALAVDFLKVDTEGTELEVLEGAHHQLASSIMGVRVNVNFQAGYKGQPLFPEIHACLDRHDFALLNLDYFGRGLPRFPLFRNPDPLSVDTERYGVLFATDGVWIRRYEDLVGVFGDDAEARAVAVLKYASFCMLNHAPDVGLDALTRFVNGARAGFPPTVQESRIYVTLRKTCATFLGRWRVYPDSQWDLARETFRAVFGMELVGGADYWELIQRL